MNQPIKDTLSIVDDKRIEGIEEIITPKKLVEKYPLDQKTADFIELSRNATSNIIHLDDPRLLVITGPCSIHNPEEALEYAELLKKVQEINPHLFLVMRTYFEKPRTTVGWKGLLNDPYLDDSCDINSGLEIARKLLLEINKMGIPTAVEFLDTITPQYIGDLVTWGAIGARTTESQEHRKLVSGLSMPVGFKNGTTGDLQIAVDAIKSARGNHSFLSVTKEGRVAKVKTSGNPDGHIILRGGANGTNYDEKSIEETSTKLDKAGVKTGIIVDFSHANSSKNHNNQPIVCEDIAKQLEIGNKRIVGVMIESNINEGNQPLSDNLKYGVSITDACVDWKTNDEMLARLNNASGKRMGN
ncbi:MAG: 3-deoxy-7-phosphoheptulonate synthase [Candidatus Gracilibacteria bacterium]|nr:3-deoxy-7-phosphoheptulonate synthase [Candidatus Gracilibacteria bacterium]